MTSKQRIDAVLAGKMPDRPPVSFWYHFPPDQIAGSGAVHAHVAQLERYELDFLKVMNDNPYPHAGRIERVEDLATLKPLRGDEEGFGRQLELISSLKAAVGDRVYLPTTLFNAWMVLRLLVEPPKAYMPPSLDAESDVPSRWIRQAYAYKPELVSAAMTTIGQNLARFAGRCLQAGADGVFLSVRDDWVDVPHAPQPHLYDRLVRPADREILAAVSTAKLNILHVCGQAVDFKAFAGYPVPVMHWADRAAGPAIREVTPWLKPALCGGVNNLGTLASGSPQQVREEVLDAGRQAGGRPIIIAPGCTFDPQRVSEANPEAMVQAVRAPS